MTHMNEQDGTAVSILGDLLALGRIHGYRDIVGFNSRETNIVAMCLMHLHCCNRQWCIAMRNLFNAGMYQWLCYNVVRIADAFERNLSLPLCFTCVDVFDLCPQHLIAHLGQTTVMMKAGAI